MNSTKDLNIFQIVTMAIFLVIGVLGIVLFATSKSGVSGSNNYKAAVWGVFPKEIIDEAFAAYSVRGIDPAFTYTEFEEEGFAQQILEAVAEGRGPDAIIFPDTMYFNQREKLVTIPSEQVTSRQFTDTYLDAGNLFAIQGGIKAFPLVIDPLVMYYNKDMLTSEGIINPPRTWKEVTDIATVLAKKRDDGLIERVSVSLGEYANVDHAKKILYTLLSQAGVRLSYYDASLATYTSGLTKSDKQEGAEGASTSFDKTSAVLTYYTNFANPLHPLYTWNRSFTSSREVFLSQNSAMYFGPGSEVQYMLSRNPNLNFAIAPVPQENPAVKATHGKTYALGFLITSQNLEASYAQVTEFFTADTMIQGLSDALGMAPAKKALIQGSQSAKSNRDTSVIYESAIYASTWMDPEEKTSNSILQTLVESVTSGLQNLSVSIQDAGDRLDRLYRGR